ncbi:MAG: hypothetical protein V1743_01165 [Nanoarchaeota archaeon]
MEKMLVDKIDAILQGNTGIEIIKRDIQSANPFVGDIEGTKVKWTYAFPCDSEYVISPIQGTYNVEDLNSILSSLASSLAPDQMKHFEEAYDTGRAWYVHTGSWGSSGGIPYLRKSELEQIIRREKMNFETEIREGHIKLWGIAFGSLEYKSPLGVNTDFHKTRESFTITHEICAALPEKIQKYFVDAKGKKKVTCTYSGTHTVQWNQKAKIILLPSKDVLPYYQERRISMSRYEKLEFLSFEDMRIIEIMKDATRKKK